MSYMVRLTRREALRAWWRPGRWLRIPPDRVDYLREATEITITAAGGVNYGGGPGCGPGGGDTTFRATPGTGGGAGSRVRLVGGYGPMEVIRRPAQCWGCGVTPGTGHKMSCPVPEDQR